jgi:hypothetical protein
LEGEGVRSFFDIDSMPGKRMVRMTGMDSGNNSSELDVGQLHGVGEGAEYVVHSEESKDVEATVATVRLTKALDTRPPKLR